MELKDFIKATQHTYVGKGLVCDVTKKSCFAKSEGRERDCERFQRQMDEQSDIFYTKEREKMHP